MNNNADRLGRSKRALGALLPHIEREEQLPPDVELSFGKRISRVAHRFTGPDLTEADLRSAVSTRNRLEHPEDSKRPPTDSELLRAALVFERACDNARSYETVVPDGERVPPRGATERTAVGARQADGPENVFRGATASPPHSTRTKTASHIGWLVVAPLVVITAIWAASQMHEVPESAPADARAMGPNAKRARGPNQQHLQDLGLSPGNMSEEQAARVVGALRAEGPPRERQAAISSALRTADARNDDPVESEPLHDESTHLARDIQVQQVIEMGSPQIPTISLPHGSPTSDMAVATGDIDGDGLADMAVATATEEIYVILGRKNGAFVTEFTVPDHRFASSVWLEDVSGDGRVDLISLSRLSSVRVSLGQPDGTFGKAVMIGNDRRPTDVSIADLDRDGRLDLLLACHGSVSIVFYRGLGAGRFDVGRSTGLANYDFDAIALADVDNDGQLDSVACGERSNTLIVHLNVWSPVELESPKDVACADLDRDGLIDIVVACKEEIVLFTNTGSGEPFPFEGTTLSSPLIVRPASLALVDLDADESMDILVAHAHGVSIVSMDAGTVTRIGAAKSYWPGVRSLTAADVTGDQRLDIIASLGGGDVKIAPGLKSGRYAWTSKPSKGAIMACDLDGDQSDECVIAHEPSSAVLVFRGGSDGLELTRQLPQHKRPTSIAVGDLLGSPVPDLVVASHEGSEITIVEDAGSGGEQHLLVDLSPELVAVWDLDGDSYGDIVLADSNGIGWIAGTEFRGQSGHENHRRVQVTRISGPQFLRGSDLAPLTVEGGKVYELGCTTRSGEVFGIKVGASGRPGLAEIYENGTEATSGMRLLDFDGDGRTDIVGHGLGYPLLIAWERRANGAYHRSAAYGLQRGDRLLASVRPRGEVQAAHLLLATTTGLAVGRVDQSEIVKTDVWASGAPSLTACTGDFDGDGDSEFVAYDSVSDCILLLSD